MAGGIGYNKTSVIGCKITVSNIYCDALFTLCHKTVKQKRIVNVTVTAAYLTVKLKSLFPGRRKLTLHHTEYDL